MVNRDRERETEFKKKTQAKKNHDRLFGRIYTLIAICDFTDPANTDYDNFASF